MSNVAKSANNRKDLSGQVFGRLKVIEYSHTKNKRAYWKCVCECGNLHIANGKYLSCGDTTSCGCSQSEYFVTKHKEASGLKTKEYRTWRRIKNRCLNPHNNSYPIYGGRGITVCESWLNSFEKFLSDMGRAPSPKHSIDRKNNDGNYEPGNCRWATARMQNNNSSNCVFIEMDGLKLSVAEWARKFNVSYMLVYKRLRRKWSLIDALSTPSKSTSSYH